MSVMFDPDTAIYPFPPKPTPLSIDEKAYYREKIKRLLKERNAVMVAHYYTDPEILQQGSRDPVNIQPEVSASELFFPD
ncbi:hypothetical protein ACUOFC_25700, partial [Escherichia sp. TWPC-MK]